MVLNISLPIDFKLNFRKKFCYFEPSQFFPCITPIQISVPASETKTQAGQASWQNLPHNMVSTNLSSFISC
jgi:hypothetical protein